MKGPSSLTYCRALPGLVHPEASLTWRMVLTGKMANQMLDGEGGEEEDDLLLLEEEGAGGGKAKGGTKSK
eukprot:2230821-Rhodomonas_salina.1